MAFAVSCRPFLPSRSPGTTGCTGATAGKERRVPVCTASPPRRARKPRGYWNDVQNIKHELLSLENKSSTANLQVMPTARFLRESGRRDIDNAISKMGGYHKVAAMLGCATSGAKRPQGYWNDFANLSKEMDAFLQEVSEELPSGTMPTLKQMRDHKRSNLVAAIEQHGGTAAVAKRLGLEQRVSRKSKHYWKDWDKVEAGIRDFVAQRAKRERKQARQENVRLNRKRALRMPTQSELRTAGRADLAEAITDYHGGFRKAAKKIGFVSSKKDDFFYDSFYNLAREIYDFVNEVELESIMPSTVVLKSEGRTDLAAAIVKYGGMEEVSQRLGLQYRVRTRQAFKDWGLFRRNLMAFMEIHGTPGEIPSSRTLTNFGRADLYQAILHHGGSRAVADRLGLKRNYWQDFYHVGAQLLQFISLHGTHGVMPTEKEFEQVGRTALNVAVSKFGYSQVAKRLGLRELPQSTSLAFDTLLNQSLTFSDDENGSEEEDEEFQQLLM